MIDEQVKKVIDKTFSELDILVREVQKKKKSEKDKRTCSEMQKSRESHFKKT